MVMPGLRERRRIDKLLESFFATYKPAAFRSAIVAVSRFYHLPSPRIAWFEYLDWGKSGGRTFEDGKICLVHPENWKRGRIYNKERMWIAMVYHEMGHYLFWTDAERKADAFAVRMVRGLRRPERRRRMSGRIARRTAAVPRRASSPPPRRAAVSSRRISTLARQRRSRVNRRRA